MNGVRKKLLVAALIAAALAAVTLLRIEQVNRLRDHGWMLTYDELASRVLEGRIPHADIAGVSAPYLWLVTLARALGIGLIAIRNLQIAAMTLAALFCGLAARRLSGRVAGVAATLLVLANGAALVVATELDPKTLLLLVLSAALFLLTGESRGTPAGLLLGLAAAIDPIGFAVLAAVLLFSRSSVRRIAAGAAASLAAVALLNLALLGTPALVPAGERFFEGNNALSTGCGGTPPRIVADLQAATRHPTAAPVYAAIAREAGRSSSTYWTRLALEWMRAHPGAALARFGWKAILSVHHYDVHDVLSSARKSVELRRVPSIPFGVAFVLAVAAMFLPGRRRLVPFAAVAAVVIAAMVLLVVNARERDVLLAPLAILGGAGASALFSFARTRPEKGLVAVGGVLIAAATLGIEGRPMLEHQYKWWSVFGLERKLLDIETPPRLFDLALGMQQRGEWATSETVLASISGYRPLRDNRAVSSVAYHRARAALHVRLPRTHVRELLERAGREAPGDPDVLALSAVAFDPGAGEELEKVADPFTRDLALALAWADHGDLLRAHALVDRLVARLPDWQRAVLARHALRTVLARSGSSGAGR